MARKKYNHILVSYVRGQIEELMHLIDLRSASYTIQRLRHPKMFHSFPPEQNIRD